jgi:peptidoglycan/LPS O-acetylase OafA/YrhL
MLDPISRNVNRGKGNVYDPNLWTLPIEFDYSLVVLLCSAAFLRLHPLIRLCLSFCLVIYCSYLAYWTAFLFISGMFLCDLNNHLEENGSTLVLEGSVDDIDLESNSKPEPGILIKIFWTTLLILDLYVMSIPEYGRGAKNSTGYETLVIMVPPKYAQVPDHFWMSISAALLVLIINRAPHLQAIFTNRLSQYLGRISYGLYLVHGPLLWSLGRATAKVAVTYTGQETDAQYGLGIFLSACITYPVIILAAHLATHYVDMKSVQLGRWLYEKLLWDGRKDYEALP